MLDSASCPACEGTSLKERYRLVSPYLDRGEVYSIYFCCGCGHKFAVGRHDDSYLSSIYSKGFHNSTQQDVKPLGLLSPIQTNANNRAIWLKELGLSGRLLDIGAGKGAFVEAASVYFQAEGLELSSDAAEQAKSRGLEVHQGDFLVLEKERDSYDLITFWDVVASFADPESALKRAWMLLEEGGRVVLTLPMGNSICAQLLGRFWPLWIPPVNLHYFSDKSIDVLANRCGFKVSYAKCNSKKISLQFIFLKLVRSLKLFSLETIVFKLMPDIPVSLNLFDIKTFILVKK